MRGLPPDGSGPHTSPANAMPPATMTLPIRMSFPDLEMIPFRQKHTNAGA